jgi:hypothetical protein
MNRVYKLPSLKRNLIRNQSIDEILDGILKLPTVRGKECIEIQIDQNDFVFKYEENKKRIKLNYSSKNLLDLNSPTAGR